jgi:predicted protein tyrosine phosphatase
MTRPLLPYRITICGLAELGEHACAGVTHVLTIIDPGFPDPADFAAYAPHRRTVWRYHDTILDGTDLIPPHAADVDAILEFGRNAGGDDIGHLLVHCHMGISRSTATAAILMAQHQPGREDEAFAHLRAIRPQSWPNSRMIALADARLGRGGRLTAAMRRHHALVARANPELAALLRQGERAGEVPDDIG